MVRVLMLSIIDFEIAYFLIIVTIHNAPNPATATITVFKFMLTFIRKMYYILTNLLRIATR